MAEIRIRDWVFECDTDATREAYSQISLGDPETCQCTYCRNFIAARHLVYPEAAVAIYGQLGVAIDREAEVYEAGPREVGVVHYGGWHHFIGSVRKDPGTMLQVTTNFSICFAEGRACAEPVFDGKPLVQVEFFTQVPWLLGEPYPSPGK